MEKKVAQKMPYVMEVETGTYAWCSFGHSSNQPYYDGSHQGSDMARTIERVTEKKTVAWCGCKASGTLRSAMVLMQNCNWKIFLIKKRFNDRFFCFYSLSLKNLRDSLKITWSGMFPFL